MSHLSSVPSALQQAPDRIDPYESEIEAVLLALKAAAVRAEEKGDVYFYADYLADDAIGVTPHGVFDKQQMLAALTNGSFRTTKVEDTRAFALSDDAGMVTYRARCSCRRCTDVMWTAGRACSISRRCWSPESGDWRASDVVALHRARSPAPSRSRQRKILRVTNR